MTEILIYQLQRQPLERVLPALIEKSVERGWRVIVQAASEERVEALDAQLWTFRDDSFLPHGTWREAEASEQPILLTLNGDNPNGAAVRFLIDGAPMPDGMEDSSFLPRITEELLRRGYREADVKKILGGNTLRVMEQVEAAARQLREKAATNSAQ